MDEVFMQPSTYNFLRLPIEFSDLEKSRFMVVQVPFDSTASYMGGARNGPHAIIRASREVELFDRELGEPYQEGIATLEETDLARGDSGRTVKMVSDVIRKIVEMGKIPVMLGGEHTITAGAAMALGKDVDFVILDAHSDLRDEYEGCKFSHACASRRIADVGNRITELGIRSMSREEMDYLSENKNVKVHFMDDIRQSGLDPVLKMLSSDLKGRSVYLSIDIDALDPSEAPGTGTPEPGGFHYREVLETVKTVCKSAKTIAGFDITEVAPIPGSHVTEFLAAKLAYKTIGYIVAKKV